MTYDPQRHHRRSIRLKEHDYTAPGAYFVTLVCHHRECLFAEIDSGELLLNAFGKIVADEWERTATIRPNVAIDSFVVMPNHLHGILVVMEMESASGMVDGSGGNWAHSSAPLPGPNMGGQPHIGASGVPPVGAHCCAPNDGRAPNLPLRPPQSLGSIVAGFKAASTRRINASRGTPGAPVWQRNYFEHIIRSDRSWERIRYYIEANPSLWAEDAENPERMLR